MSKHECPKCEKGTYKVKEGKITSTHEGKFCSECLHVFEWWNIDGSAIEQPKKSKKKKSSKKDKEQNIIKYEDIDFSTLEDIELNRIYNEDCLITMKRMPDNTVDHIITSPPYNIGGSTYEKYEELDDGMSHDDYFQWSVNILNECLRVTKHYIFWNIQMVSGNKFALHKLIGHFSEYIKEVAIWNKNIAAPAHGEGIMNSKWEYVLILSKKDPHLRQFKDAQFPKGKLENVWDIKRTKNKFADVHKAVFPLNLPRFIIQNFATKGQVVYEPFTGTGTTPAACILEGCQYIGSELSEKYYSIIEQNIKEYTEKSNQIDLYDVIEDVEKEKTTVDQPTLFEDNDNN